MMKKLTMNTAVLMTHQPVHKFAPLDSAKLVRIRSTNVFRILFHALCCSCSFYSFLAQGFKFLFEGGKFGLAVA